MRKYLSAAVLLLAAAPLALPQRARPTVTFVSPVECKGDHGKWRWKVKTERARPPDFIPADHRVTPADVAGWEVPDRKVTTRTPRFGRETEWFELTGKVVLVRAEPDGDLHVQLGDPRGEGRLQVVVEVPVDHGHPDSAWSGIRSTVFGWSDQVFPFRTVLGHGLHLKERPVVRVVGKAFYDAAHAKASTPNRRRGNALVTVWEIHPIMRLEVVKKGPRARDHDPGDSWQRPARLLLVSAAFWSAVAVYSCAGGPPRPADLAPAEGRREAK
jgi:hypothetical protein